MFKVGKYGQHIWLKSEELTPLLTWKDDDGKTYTFEGKTFEKKEANSQWFSQFVVKAEGDSVLDVQRKDDSSPGASSMRVLLDSKEVHNTTNLLQHSASANVSLTYGHTLEIQAAGLTMTIFSSSAKKFSKGDEMRVQNAHLNVKFDAGLPQHSSGVFAEMAGVAVMSEATKAMIKPKPNPNPKPNPKPPKPDGSEAMIKPKPNPNPKPNPKPPKPDGSGGGKALQP